MDAVDAYCTVCDARIRVRIPPGESGELEFDDVECPHADLCSPECLLEKEDVEIADFLEFLPARAASRGRRGFRPASVLVEEARRNSMARERRRWLKWWGGR